VLDFYSERAALSLLTPHSFFSDTLCVVKEGKVPKDPGKTSQKGSDTSNKPVQGSGGLTPAHGKTEKISHTGFGSKLPVGSGDGSSVRD
jgi:hypothetical protein